MQYMRTLKIWIVDFSIFHAPFVKWPHTYYTFDTIIPKGPFFPPFMLLCFF